MGNFFSDLVSNPVNFLNIPLGMVNTALGNPVNLHMFDKPEPAAPAESGEEPAMEEMGGQGLEAANKYYEKMTALAEEEAARSRELWNLYKTKYLPGEMAWAKQAFAGVPADQAVNRASSDVNTSFDKAANIQARNMQGLGINPASPAYQANQADVQQARAAAEAGARTNARKGINDTNWSRRSQAVSLGRGLLPASSSLSAQGGNMISQGYSGVANANNAALGAQLSQQNLAAQQAFQAQQNQLSREWQQQLADQNAQGNMYSGLMGLVGTGLGAYFGGGAGAAVGGAAGNTLGNAYSPDGRSTTTDVELSNTDTTNYWR